MSEVLHKAQLSILYSLRRTPTARFSELMKPTQLQSDVFKFHLRKLIHEGYVQKHPNGSYGLTSAGKEFANNLNRTTRKTQQQPKLSLLLIASKPADNGETQYLLQQRKRQPFFDYWGCLSGPAQWGEAFEITAHKELLKQTDLQADFTVRSFYRSCDYDSLTQTILEDKLFVVLEAANIHGTLTNSWSGGHNAWMTLSDLQTQPKYFALTTKTIEMAQKGNFYAAYQPQYEPRDY